MEVALVWARTSKALTPRNRCIVTCGDLCPGQNVLITGVGGGVALLALQICAAKGANVYVTSGTNDKIVKAIDVGAKAGVSYKDRLYILSRPPSSCSQFTEDWPEQLEKLLARDGQRYLDVVIDSAGGDARCSSTTARTAAAYATRLLLSFGSALQRLSHWQGSYSRPTISPLAMRSGHLEKLETCKNGSFFCMIESGVPKRS